MCRDKMRDIENILKTRIENDEANTFVVIVPTDAARLKRQRELVGYHPNRAVASLRVHGHVKISFKDYITKCVPRKNASHKGSKIFGCTR